ncbi:HalOD1 output domain-containing protein [Haloarcula litorea]|uniref:HalOD1 output domain-containing protein n=1 Tax=Haloarcula litorea TaxID=3032579 RepID=UPI0023E866D0|nr:HalOD1 output domain-containing protein [Halomicroarcula sp. GDY20]
MAPDSTLSLAVAEAVAEAEDVDPTELGTPLFPAVDGDALDELFRQSSGHVTFEYAGYEVTAASDGDVSVAPLTDT